MVSPLICNVMLASQPLYLTNYLSLFNAHYDFGMVKGERLANI